MKMNRRFISLITILTMVLSVPFTSIAATEEPVAVTENTTIVDVSGIEEGQAASDELLVLVDEGTTKKQVSGIAEDAGASLDNISTLEDGTRLAKVTLDGEKDAKEVAEEIGSDDAVLIVQPNYIYYLESAGDDPVSEGEAGKDTSDAAAESSDQVTGDEEGTPDTGASEHADNTATDEATVEAANTEDGDEETVDADANTAEAQPESTLQEQSEATRTVKVVDHETLKVLKESIDQWYLGNTGAGINAQAAWNELTPLSQGNEVTVAVLDTGVKLDHSDLQGKIIEDKCVTYNKGVKGDFYMKDNSDDDDGHGTHVCGLIAANANDDYGMKGVTNDRAKIFVVDTALTNGGFTTEDLRLGIDYAVKKHADIINISIGGLYKDYIQESAIQIASDNGTLVVCAAGNFSSDMSESPGDSSAALSVMSHTSGGNKSSFSDFGVYKDVSAPGSNIVSTYIGGSETVDNYSYINGTSMASPIVAGIAALIKSADPDINTRELKNYIYTSSGSQSFSPRTAGFGKVNAYTAVKNVKASSASPEEIVLNSTALDLWPGETFSLEYAVYPGNASKYADDLTFSSSDENVAKVDANGKVEAAGPGEATITAACHGVTKKCQVTVEDIDYESVEYPCDYIEGSFTSSSHKLPVTMTIDDVTHTFEALVKGYQIDVTNTNDNITLMAISSDAEPMFRVFDPDGNEVTLEQESYGNYAYYVGVADLSPASTGAYKIQLMCDLTGEKITGVDYAMAIDCDSNVDYADVSGVRAKTYTGKAHSQSPVVAMDGTVLKYGIDYTLEYRNNINAGTAVMIIKGIGDYRGSKEVSFKINKAGNGLYAKGKTYKIKRSKVRKKAKKVAVSKVMTVKRANGALKFTKVSGSKKLSISKSTGAVKIKKNTKKGTYKMKVRVTALGDANHNGATRQVTIKVKVK